MRKVAAPRFISVMFRKAITHPIALDVGRIESGPLPGSLVSIANGCTCPHEQHPLIDGAPFFVDAACPLHTIREGSRERV